MRRPATGAAGRSSTILRQSGTQNNMVPEVMRANSLPGKFEQIRRQTAVNARRQSMAPLISSLGLSLAFC